MRGVLKCFYLVFVESSVQLEVEVSFSFRQKKYYLCWRGDIELGGQFHETRWAKMGTRGAFAPLVSMLKEALIQDLSKYGFWDSIPSFQRFLCRYIEVLSLLHTPSLLVKDDAT